MDAVSAGSVEGLTRGELNEEVERIEREVRRRLPIGWSTSYASLVKEFVTSQGYSQHALERTLFIMEKREVIRFSGQVRRRPRRLCFPYRCLTLPSPRGLLSLPSFLHRSCRRRWCIESECETVHDRTLCPSLHRSTPCFLSRVFSFSAASSACTCSFCILPFLSSYDDHFALLSDCRRRAAVVQRTTTSIGALRRRDAETETEEQKGRERNGQRDPEQEENEDKAR